MTIELIGGPRDGMVLECSHDYQPEKGWPLYWSTSRYREAYEFDGKAFVFQGYETIQAERVK